MGRMRRHRRRTADTVEPNVELTMPPSLTTAHTCLPAPTRALRFLHRLCPHVRTSTRPSLAWMVAVLR